MAVQLVTKIYRWSGLSTDEKPSSGVPGGSTFHETDTGNKFIYQINDWVVDNGGPLSTAKAVEMNAEIRRLMDETLVLTLAANERNGIDAV